jgi:hypothetical protein
MKRIIKLPTWLDRYPDWVVFSVVGGAIDLVVELLLGHPPTTVLVGALVGGAFSAVVLRYWLLPPYKGKPAKNLPPG